MKMSRVPTSLTAACIAAFGAKVLVKTGTSVPTTGKGAEPAPSQITIGRSPRLRFGSGPWAVPNVGGARTDLEVAGLALSVTP